MENTGGILKNTLDIGKCFSSALEAYKKNLPILLLAILILQVGSIITLLILAGPLSGGYFLMSLKAMRSAEKKVNLNDMFQAFNIFVPLLGLFIIQIILIALGFILLIIPGIMLSTLWLYALLIMVDKNQDIVSALKGSWNLVKEKGFMPNLLISIIYIACGTSGSVIPQFGWLIALLLMPFAYLLITSAYIQQADEG